MGFFWLLVGAYPLFVVLLIHLSALTAGHFFQEPKK